MTLLRNPVIWLVGLVIILAFWGIGSYNSYVFKLNGIEGQWKQVEVQYQRRYDLIPNLVESVKGIMKQEQKIFIDLADARSRYTGAPSVEAQVKAANEVESAFGRLLAVFENYPQLKSDQAVLKLMDEIAGTENRISVERRRYNELVQDYNTSIALIPGRWFARVFGFTPKSYFETAKGSEKAPAVKL